MNYDSNANAAPSSGNITVLDTNVPLGQGARTRRDFHAFSAATLAHIYQPSMLSRALSMRWKSSALLYSTKQHNLNNLDITLLGLRSGPEFFYEPMGLRVELAAGYNYLALDGYAYMRNPRGEINIDLPIDAQLTLLLSHVREYREFLNAPTVTTYSDRSGNAWQHQFGLRYVASQASVWEAMCTVRREDASQLYYANNQSAFSLTNTHLFAEGYFAQGRVGMKYSKYDGADFLISSRARADNERTAQLTLGRQIAPLGITISGSYTFTRVNSNIQNYTYDDHRIGFIVTKAF